MSIQLLDARETVAVQCARQRGGSRPPRGRGALVRSARRAQPRAERPEATAHIPVLASELVELLDVRPGQIAVDCTFGGGGHAHLVAQRLGTSGTLIGIDRDPLAEQRFSELAREVSCSVRFIRAGYAEALQQLAAEGVRVDLAYFDLGMSSMQVDTRERGFSYSFQAPLDMRMDPAQQLDARTILASYDQRALTRLLREFGEERHAAAIAKAIVNTRATTPIESTIQLVDLINSAIPTPARFAGSHPAKRVFQALRIAVNDELGQLERGLPLAFRLLRKDGVLAAISFHSLEDRRVKRFLAELARGCICPPDFPICTCGREPQAKLLTRRAISPSNSEITSNPRAASARLRAARKLTDGGGQV